MFLCLGTGQPRLVLAAQATLGRTRPTIPEVEPQRSVVREHAADLREHRDQPRHEFFGCRLKANLPSGPVIALTPVGGRGHATTNAARRQRLEHIAAIALNGPPPLMGTPPAPSRGAA